MRLAFRDGFQQRAQAGETVGVHEPRSDQFAQRILQFYTEEARIA